MVPLPLMAKRMMIKMDNPWEQIEKPSSDLNVRLADASHPLSLYWGRDAAGRYLFIFETAEDCLDPSRKLPRLVGINTGIIREDGYSRLVLLLKESANWEIFYSLCADLIRATTLAVNSNAAAEIILRRLSRWQDFLKAERRTTLAPVQIKGLIGELLLLSQEIAPRYSWSEAVNAWKGPEGGVQDFALRDTAIEVKCQAGASKPMVQISSIDQLEPQLPNGFLAVFTLADSDPEDADGFTLNSFIQGIRKQIMNEPQGIVERFEDLLYQYGYIWHEDYESQYYKRIAMRLFRLCESFPRIRSKDVPNGVEAVGFSIRLECCSPFEVTVDEMGGTHED